MVDKRNYGIDLLRLVSMFMVVVLHTLGQGGVIELASLSGASYWTAWTLETASYCAVNVFAIISGYVGWKSKPKLSKLAGLWFQTMFWCSIILLIYMYTNLDVVNREEIYQKTLKAFLPVSANSYWYITSYFGLCLLMPILNCAIENMPEKYLRYTVTAIFLMFSVNPIVLASDAFKTSAGYSTIWLVVLYIFGGYFSKYNFFRSYGKKTYTLLYISSVLLTVLSKFIFKKMTSLNDSFLISYTSPTIVICSVALVGLFSGLKINKSMQTFIKIFSPCSLGVYIIHVNPIIWTNIINDMTAWVNTENCLIMTMQISGTALSVFFICLILEFIRLIIFRALKISKSLEKIDVKIFNRINRN